jgi:hypothetical protein
MPFDFSSFLVASGEKPASSTKFNNFLAAVQAGMNAMPPANLTGFPADAAKFLNGAGGWTTPVTDMAQVFVKAAAGPDIQGTTLQDLFNFTIPAGRLGPNAAIKIYAAGDYLNNDTGTRTLRLSLALGAQTIWDVTGPSGGTGTASNRRNWHFEAVIQALGSLVNQESYGDFELNQQASPATGMGVITTQQSSAAIEGNFLGVATSVNMGGAQTIRLQAAHSASQATLLIRSVFARVEVTA